MIKEIFGTDSNDKALLVDKKKTKIIRSKDGYFNHYFDKETGLSMTWGKNKEDDPTYSPYGPLIADIEITTICHGPGGKVCDFCYKSNSPKGTYMSFETYKKLFEKLPKTIGQIAFGIDATGTSNPDMWKIFEYTRENGIVPNLTIADVSDEVADKIASVAGACAVSLYDNKDLCYDSVKKLTDRGMTQVNIHRCYHDENIHTTEEIINDIKNDPRLEKLNAIVFLALKKKGRGRGFNCASSTQFKGMIDLLLESGISFGFDSCSCGNWLNAVKDHPNYNQFFQMSDPCESSCFSIFIDTHGDFYPCSFCENEKEWQTGISVLDCEDFIQDVWFHERTKAFRSKLLWNGRNCPMYNLTGE